jgi:signal transduction histidine kinase
MKILIIEDSGIGISKEDLPRVFEQGFTGYNGRMDKKASGLGLYLCKKVMDNLSHRIKIESEEGVGTKVLLNLFFSVSSTSKTTLLLFLISL